MKDNKPDPNKLLDQIRSYQEGNSRYLVTKGIEAIGPDKDLFILVLSTLIVEAHTYVRAGKPELGALSLEKAKTAVEDYRERLGSPMYKVDIGEKSQPENS